MTTLDTQRTEWIRNNLMMTHNQLSATEARNWLKLHLKDPKEFFSYAVFGFVLRRKQEKGQTEIPHDEMLQFCGEFILKIRLAISRRKYQICLPLFDVVGTEILQNFKVISGQDEIDSFSRKQ